MHEDLTSYDCIAILYSPIKVKNNYKQLKKDLFSTPIHPSTL